VNGIPLITLIIADQRIGFAAENRIAAAVILHHDEIVTAA